MDFGRFAPLMGAPSCLTMGTPMTSGGSVACPANSQVGALTGCACTVPAALSPNVRHAAHPTRKQHMTAEACTTTSCCRPDPHRP